MLIGSAEATLPITLDALPSGGYQLTVCLGGLRAVNLVPGVVQLGLIDVRNPDVAGVYDWSALVTPFDAAGQPDSMNASELRAHAPLPQTLTIKASYSARTKLLTVRGRLLMASEPRAGARIHVNGYAADGLSILYFGSTSTGRTGAYVFRRRFAKQPRFVAAGVEVATSPCTGASTAPQGCTSESLPAVDAGPAPVALVGKR
jgi:hypothetical protein